MRAFFVAYPSCCVYGVGRYNEGMNDTSNPAAHVAIDIAGPLKCKPDDVVKYVVVKVGDDVEEHGLLAQKNSFFGKTEIK